MNFVGHGGKEIVERVVFSQAEAKEKIEGLEEIEVTGRCARECINICYGFFTPLEGFMRKEDVISVCEKMTLKDGTLWSIPIVLDVEREDAERIKKEDKILLTYKKRPLAICEVEDIFFYDKTKMAEAVLGTTSEKHPGMRIFKNMKDTFIGGKITLVNKPKFNMPYDRFWYTPKKLREEFEKRGWKKIVAHQTRNVPHTGHEWLMKGAWFSANNCLPVEKLQTGILVSCIIGPKREGDYIDEAILLSHKALQEAGYFREDIHMVSFVLWDMRYAGPKEAIFHAILRENMGCTHHMFGRDHAGVGSFYDPYDAHRIFDRIPQESLNIKPVRVLEWWYCPVCREVTYSGLCGHRDKRQNFSGTMIRSMVQDKVKPTPLVLRPEVFEVVQECAQKYGFGSPFCTKEYLEKRQPVFELESF